MSWLDGRVSSRRARRRFVGLTIRGENEPEVYRVSEDVFRIIGKMLRLNQAVGPYRGFPLVEFAEIRFLARLLGAPTTDCGFDVDLWIAEE